MGFDFLNYFLRQLFLVFLEVYCTDFQKSITNRESATPVCLDIPLAFFYVGVI